MEIVAEEWRAVSTDGYEVSSRGRVRSVDREVAFKDGRIARYRGRVLRQWINCRGYCVACIGAGTRKTVHALVAEAFIGSRPDGLVINHKDGNKTNNTPINLEYITNLENIRHANRIGLARNPKGERNGRSKLTCEMVSEIRLKRQSGVVLRVLADQYGVTLQVIHAIVKRKTWNHVA
jgi:hypothetical protein